MRFVVIGGGCYGSFYARQLIRAADAGAIPQPEIVVVDHNAEPQVVREVRDTRVRHVRSDWDAFFDDYMQSVSVDSDDQIVPPPFTPHLALRWLMRRLEMRDPAVKWLVEPFSALPITPFAQQSGNGTLNASHADWLCPVHCIEPEVCPHTRGKRDWDMADTVKAFARSISPQKGPVEQVHLFQCLHFTHGVGTYPAASVQAAFEQLVVASESAAPQLYAIVGTVSRCHGTMHLLKAWRGTDTVSPASTPGGRADASR